MPKFKVTATMDVGYELIVEARNEAEAWELAGDADIDGWESKGGQDWTMENVFKHLPVEGCEECEFFETACPECILYGEAKEVSDNV